LLLKFRALLSPATLLLLPWAALAGFALRTGPYGLNEEGAKALLLAWSLGDQVPSAVFTLGAPDIRAIFFLPLGFLWPGQVIAAKLLTLLTMAGAGVALYCWRARDEQTEAALLATGLLLIAPLTLDSIDSLAAAPFLLAIFGAASWLNRMVSRERGTLGGWFFAQLLGCAAAVSLHPAGLAYPAVLIFYWLAEPRDRRERQIALLGIPLVVVLVLVMRLGWTGVLWGQNPLPSAAAIFGGRRSEDAFSSVAWLGGFALIALTLAVALHEGRRLLADLTGGTLLLAVLFGAVAADRTWALLMLALLLYGGFPWLLRACAPLASRGLMVQRGWLWLLLLLICTAFLRVDRRDFEAGRRNLLSAEDELISDFAVGIDGVRNQPTEAGRAVPILVASSWPARTSIACKCAALPLPPAAKDPASQLAMMRGVSYVILSDTMDNMDNRALANNFAQLSSRMEVLSKRAGGVILHINPVRTDR